MPAKEISTKEAKPDKLFYFLSNVVVYRTSDSRCLILKRSERETAHPGKWAVPGGKLEWQDLDLNNPTRVNGDILDFENVVEDLAIREAREEASVEVENEMKYINSVAFVRPDGIPVVLVKMAAKYKGGEVVLEEEAFDDFAWVDIKEVKSYDCIKGVQEEVAKTIELFNK